MSEDVILYSQVEEFFANFDMELDQMKYNKPITLARYITICTVAKKWHGEMFFQFVMDCFIPTGEATSPDFEDSLSHYIFDPPSWDQMKESLGT